jgi:hypothetical protein
LSDGIIGAAARLGGGFEAGSDERGNFLRRGYDRVAHWAQWIIPKRSNPIVKINADECGKN